MQTNPNTSASVTTRMPVVFLSHGGGPWPFIEMGMRARGGMEELEAYLRSVGSVPRVAPKAVLVVSAHWEERVPSVMMHPHPPMLYDYYGFPAAAYELTWPAPGDPVLGARVAELLEANGFETAADSERGFDHGCFVPMKLMYPDASIPTLQLSLKLGLDPREHLAIGRALAPLRNEGVFIVGSGASYHNLREFSSPSARGVSETFDTWLTHAATSSHQERAELLAHWQKAPQARAAHPREEHLLPLMVVAGAAGEDPGVVGYSGYFWGAHTTAYHYG